MLVGLPLELRGSVVPENGGFVNVKSGCNTTFFPYAQEVKLFQRCASRLG